MTETDPWLNNMNNCYILFDPERKETMARMQEFISTKIDPVIVLSCFVMNTHRYLEDFKINDHFVQETIKKFVSSDDYDKEMVDRIRSLVFCGKNMTTEPLFLNIWTTIVAKFLPDGDVDAVEGRPVSDPVEPEQAVSEVVE
jgi:hypothetical protein